LRHDEISCKKENNSQIKREQIMMKASKVKQKNERMIEEGMEERMTEIIMKKRIALMNLCLI